MRRKLIMIVLIFMLMTDVACASNPPQAIITCKGCQEISEGYLLVYADNGSTMTLSGISSQDDVGVESYVWTKDGVVVSKNTQYSFVVTEHAKYVLTVTDKDGKSDSETVEIQLKYVAPPIKYVAPLCLPDWKGEIVLSNKEDLEIGDEIILNANLKPTDCVDYKIEWNVDDNNIVIFNKSSKKTKIKIGNGTRIGTHVIKVLLSNNEKSKEHKAQINIVKNTPPTLVIDYKYPYSYGTLYVDLSGSKTGSSGNEDNDYFRRCYVRLEDKNGTFVSDGSWNVKHNKMPLSVKVKTVKMGTHFIYVEIEDSHGAVSAVREEIWVQEGDSKLDPLIIRVSSDKITCVAGEECKFSAYQTCLLYEGKDINFAYYDVTYEDHPERLANPNGYYLTGPSFRHIFPNSGNFVVRIKATSGNRKGSKEIDVVVTENETKSNLTPIPAPTPIPKPMYTPGPYRTSTPPTETPGMEFRIAIVVLIMAFVFKKRKK